MKLEATSVPLQKYGQASVGKNHKSETPNEEFSDALKTKSGKKDNAGTDLTTETENKTNNGTEPEHSTKKQIRRIDQSEAIIIKKIAINEVVTEKIKTQEVATEENVATSVNSDTDVIEIPTDKQEGKFNERVPTHHLSLLAHQTLMERLTTSNTNKINDQQGNIAIDEMHQSAGMPRNLIKEHASASDMKFKAVSQSRFPEKGAIGNDILENQLTQKETRYKTGGLDVDFKNLPANQIFKQAAMTIDQKQAISTRTILNPAAKQISGNTNSKMDTPGANSDIEVQSVVKKDNALTQVAKEKTIGELKLGEVKFEEKKIGEMLIGEKQLGEKKIGEVKVGETKSVDVKIGEVRLERVAPSNLNQVIINALSSTGKISPISTNVITSGQLSTQLQKTLTIQLHPENLGVVEVKISDKNGKLSISVETTTLAAEKILKAEISVLTEKLAISGILHDEMTVRNNPGLDIVRESNSLERNGGMNSNQAGDGQLAKNGEDDFKQQLREPKVSDENKIGEGELISAASREAGNKRDGIYL